MSVRVAWILVATILAISGASPAIAHVKVYAEPGYTHAPACSFTQFLVVVPDERPDSTISVEVDIPSSVTVSATQPVPGWSTALAKDKGRISRITWTRGQIHPHEFQTFEFQAGTPQSPQLLSWNARQTYQNGEVVSWTGNPNSDMPHSQITITPALDTRDCRPRKAR
jgi:uncharacterized protein YcnI